MQHDGAIEETHGPDWRKLPTRTLQSVVPEREMARLIGVSIVTARRMRTEARGPRHIRIDGKRYGYRLADIYAWLDSRSAGGQASA